MNLPDQNSKNQKWFLLVLYFVIVPVITIGGFFLYLKLNTLFKSDEVVVKQEQQNNSNQLPEEVQLQCQDSIDNVLSASDFSLVLKEFKENAETCFSAFVKNKKNKQFLDEDLYLNFILPLANQHFIKDAKSSAELLEIGKNLDSWDININTNNCDSKQVLEAYLESYKNNNPEGCLDIKNLEQKDFKSILANIKFDQVINIKALNSNMGCPDKASSIVKLLEENAKTKQSQNTEPNVISFENAEGKPIVLDYTVKNNCISLNSVSIPTIEE